MMLVLKGCQVNNVQVSSDDYKQKINGEWMHFYQVTVIEPNQKERVFVFDNPDQASAFKKGVVSKNGV